MSGAPIPEYMDQLLREMLDESLSPQERLDAARGFDMALALFQVDLVDAARKEGKSWRQIGKALGISRQAAHQKYGR